MIEDEHLTCDGWPNCDIIPDLCIYNGHQSQLIGHKDPPNWGHQSQLIGHKDCSDSLLLKDIEDPIGGPCSKCGSSNALVTYPDHTFCFSCKTFNKVRKTKHLESFIKRILELSEADTWEKAKLEWKLDRIDFTIKEKGESCLCGKTPICELCQITNSLNGNSTQVGNVCIDKFTDLPSNLIFTNIKKVLEDIDKSFNEATIEYIYERGWINEWECGFLINTKRKRKLTNKQYKKRVSINRKILLKFNIEGNYVSQGEEKANES